MLEKITGLALANKLQIIFPMKDDFVFHNKLVFGSRMLYAARSNRLIPPEQYSEQRSTAEDGSFNKILQGDVFQ